MLRGLIGVAVGLLTAAAFFQASSSLLLLATDGIPLGAESRSSTFLRWIHRADVTVAVVVGRDPDRARASVRVGGRPRHRIRRSGWVALMGDLV